MIKKSVWELNDLVRSIELFVISRYKDRKLCDAWLGGMVYNLKIWTGLKQVAFCLETVNGRWTFLLLSIALKRT